MRSFDAFRRIFGGVALSICLAAQPAFSAAQTASGSPVASGQAFRFVASDASTGLKEYQLKSNGLNLLLAERHSSPVVTVMLVYRVGSRNEAVGYTGSTHFLEHMMFKGTSAHDPLKGTGIDDILKPIGGLNNATTYYDRTYYYEVVPSAGLETCLKLEADRMRNALLRESDRRSEMTVVRNELERNENFAATILDTQVFATAFREHPYHHPVIGWRSDVEGVPTSRLKQFYNDFYYPNNATLIIIGDFKSDALLQMVSSYFGKVPKSPKPFPPVYTVEPPQEGERRFTVQRGAELPKITLAYHIPPAKNPDCYPLEVLASLLGDQQRQSSRLYKSLVDSGLASQSYANNYSLHDPGLFTVYASANEGVTLHKIEKNIKDELRRLASEPVSDAELDRAKKALWKKMKLQAADPIGMAQQLAEAVAVADWQWWLNLDKNFKAVTKQDIQRVAAKYFTDSNCTVGSYLPVDKNKEADKTSSIQDTQTTMSLLGLAEADAKMINARAIAPIAKGQPQIKSESSIASRVKRKQLSNGLTVLVLPIKGSGVVAVSTKIKAGQTYSTGDKTLLPDFVGEMLNKGSKQISKEALADQLEMLGTAIDPDVGNFWTEFSSEVVTEDLDSYLGLLAPVLEEPAFKSGELDKVKKVKESELKDAMVETGEVAVNTLMGALYKPGCVFYRKPFERQLAELASINADDLKAFHSRYFNPANACIAVVGDVEAEKAFASVESALGNWKKGPTADVAENQCGNDPDVKPAKIIKQIKDKTSVDIVIGKPADCSIKSTDFYAAQLANAALGHDTISSRLAEIREKHGLTYGVQSYFMDVAEKNSPWVVQLSVNPENTAKALTLVDKIVSDFGKTGMTDEELKTEKERLSGEYVVYRLRTPRQIADALTKYEFLGVGPQFMDNYPNNLKKVTKAEANAAIHKYMNIKRMVTSLAGSISADTKLP